MVAGIFHVPFGRNEPTVVAVVQRAAIEWVRGSGMDIQSTDGTTHSARTPGPKNAAGAGVVEVPAPVGTGRRAGFTGMFSAPDTD